MQELMVKSGETTLINVTGQRISESGNRANNMKKQQVSHKTAELLQAEIEDSESGIKRFAPIRDWSTEEVFIWHKMAGVNPILKSLLDNPAPINSYLNNHGVLIELYGNASNDVCSVVVGEVGKQAGCGGKARYGCHQCTQVLNDVSGENNSRYVRWNILGGENALRVREHLLRLSRSSNARAFHAKAIDFVGFNRIALQSNVLKSTHLESICYFASQLAQDSIAEAARFKSLVESGREMEHEGYAEIANDLSMSDEIRSEMMAMYKECAVEPIYTTYSEKHALLQSLLWAKDGVASLPFRPLKIWHNVLEGKRLPWPKTNKEWEAQHGSISLALNLKEARMMPLLTKKAESEFNPMTSPHYLSYHQSPYSLADLFGEDHNCDKQVIASNALPVTVNASCVNPGTYEINKIEINGKSMNPAVVDMLASDVNHQLDCMGMECGQTIRVKLSLPFFEKSEFSSYLNKDPKAATSMNRKLRHKTERTLKRVKGKYVRGTTRLNFYKPELAVQDINATTAKSYFELNFNTNSIDRWNTADVNDDDFDTNANIEINNEALADWKQTGGIERALELHDNCLAKALNNGTRIRKFYSTAPVNILLSSGGFMIKPHYQATFLKMLQRTELFAEIGAFDVMNWSQERLDNDPHFISMAEHRKDKIRAVNLIRDARNQARAERKIMMDVKTDHALLAKRIRKDWEKMSLNAQEAIKLIADGLRVKLTGIQTHYDFNAVNQARSAALWLSIYNEALTDSKTFIKTVLPSDLASQLIASSSSIGVATMMNETLTELKNNSTLTTQYFRNTHNQLMDNVETPAMWNQFIQQQFEIESYIPEFRLSGKMLMARIEDKHRVVGEFLTILDGFNSASAQSIKLGKSKVAKGIGLSQRLAMMSRCA